MLKFMFLDYRDLEIVRGFDRCFEPPQKHPDNPLALHEKPWEKSLLGTVLKLPGEPFRLWYSATDYRVALLESDDGLAWRRPELPFYEHEGEKTNVIDMPDFCNGCVMYDEREPDPERRYKSIGQVSPSWGFGFWTSPDGLHWEQPAASPVIGVIPDGSISLFRRQDGRFVMFRRNYFSDRRVGVSESLDCINWAETKLILEPGPEDPPQLQFYYMTGAPYGDFDLGTVGAYHTDETESRYEHMRGYLDIELAYCRGGYAWHRLAPGTPFIPHGEMGSWEQGNLHASAAPVYLEDEIRFYYRGQSGWHGGMMPDGVHKRGLGLASCRPDRFLALEADSGGDIVSMAFWLKTPEIFVNANVQPGGQVRLEILDEEFAPIEGFVSAPLTGDGTSLPVRWEGEVDLQDILLKPIRFRLRAEQARVYSVWMTHGDENPVYHRFETRRPVSPDKQIERYQKTIAPSLGN